MKIAAFAKINLTLDITGVREDGYHLLEMIMQSVSLCDIITLSENEGGISLSVSDVSLPSDESNIAYRAAQLFYQNANLSPRVHIDIEKNIPAAAGLGGGSADAAAVLAGLNIMNDSPLNREKLLEIGLSLGADVPFCIVGGTAKAQGIGEKLTDLPDLPDCALVIIKACDKPSTGQMYRTIDSLPPVHPDNEKVLSALYAGDIDAISHTLGNSFDPAWYDTLAERARKALLDAGAIGACLSGSGPSVFGIFKTADAAQLAIENLQKEYDNIHIALPERTGIRIIG